MKSSSFILFYLASAELFNFALGGKSKESKTERFKIKGLTAPSKTSKKAASLKAQKESTGSCSADEFLRFADDLEDALEHADLPTSDLDRLIKYILTDVDSDLIWSRHRVKKTFEPACVDSKPLEVIRTSPGTWCMNLESTPAAASSRRLQETSTVSGATCSTPGGSYSESCQSISVSSVPDADGNCNMAAICQNESSDSPTVWNQANWRSSWALPSIQNINGVLEGTVDLYVDYSGTLACANNLDVPSGCWLKYYSLLANNLCSVKIACLDEQGGMHITTGTYRNTTATIPTNLYVNSSLCVLGDSWTPVRCGYACATPTGSWQNAPCVSTLVSPWASYSGGEWICSMSTSCQGSGIQNISNRGTYLATLQPPSLYVNQDGCALEDGQSETSFSSNLCQMSSCPQLDGSFYESCYTDLVYTGPDIQGNCHMSVTCTIPKQGTTSNALVYNYDNGIPQNFYTNSNGCVDNGVTTPSWTLTTCTFSAKKKKWFKWAVLVGVAIAAVASCAVGCEGMVAISADAAADAAADAGADAVAESVGDSVIEDSAESINEVADDADEVSSSSQTYNAYDTDEPSAGEYAEPEDDAEGEDDEDDDDKDSTSSPKDPTSSPKDPTRGPTRGPTNAPTREPTRPPTPEPTTPEPTTPEPTPEPTTSPTTTPSVAPSVSVVPSISPTI